MKKLTLILLSTALVLSPFALTGCAVTTAGIKKGDERNFVRSLDDMSAARAIKSRMRRAVDVQLGNVDIEVAQGIVLLSGNVRDPKFRIEAERIAWSAPNVTEVGNEIKIKDTQGFVRNAKDGVLNQSVRTRLIAEKSVKARNFNIETHDGTVYLLGVARTKEELERAAQIASTTRGTREVISYVRVAKARPAPQSYPIYQPQPQSQYQSQAMPSASAPQYRALPQALSATPTPSQPVALDPTMKTLPFRPQAHTPQAVAGTPVPSGVAGKDFPSDEALGKYRVGTPGEAVSVIESAPYYVDPNTGKEIPVSYITNRAK